MEGDAGGDQQQEVLRPQMAMRHEPIQPECYRQKVRAVEECDSVSGRESVVKKSIELEKPTLHISPAFQPFGALDPMAHEIAPSRTAQLCQFECCPSEQLFCLEPHSDVGADDWMIENGVKSQPIDFGDLKHRSVGGSLIRSVYDGSVFRYLNGGVFAQGEKSLLMVFRISDA